MSYPDLCGDGQQPTAAWWRLAAQATIRAYCGWHVAPNLTETITLDADGGDRLLLPSKHVTAVTSVLVDGHDLTGQVRWSKAGILQAQGFTFPDLLGGVEVTLTHGYQPEEVPHVVMLAETIAQRAKSMPGVQSQSVNGASVSYLTAGGAPLSVPLLDIEKQMLDPYRLNWGTR